MPTFLALQCYKCNMMQVKHDKKSSNKWSCSVCNEKQSVRKVFATSTAAKDIRKFVQDYNLTCNITQDRALAELVQKADKGCSNTGSMGDDAPTFNIFCDEFSQPRVKTGNKWTEYLSPENVRLYTETSEGALDDAKFVTTIPEKFGRKPKGRVRGAVEEQDEQFPLHQQQGLSFTTGRNGNFLNTFIKSFTECQDDMQKENDLPSLWARKTSSGSSLQVQKNANIHHRKQLVGFKIPQETVADISLHRRKGNDPNGERVLVQVNFETKSDVASKMPEIMKEKPVSKWATYLDLTEDVRDQSTRTIPEQDKHVSKWAKYADFDEVKPRVEALQNSGPAAKWAKFLDASEESSPKPGQSQELSSIKAGSNLQCLNSLELDELFNISEEVDEEVHPLFL